MNTSHISYSGVTYMYVLSNTVLSKYGNFCFGMLNIPTL